MARKPLPATRVCRECEMEKPSAAFPNSGSKWMAWVCHACNGKDYDIPPAPDGGIAAILSDCGEMWALIPALRSDPSIRPVGVKSRFAALAAAERLGWTITQEE